MDNYATILNATIPAFLTIGVGMLLRKLKVIDHLGDKSFLSLLMNCLIPCLTLDALIGNQILQQLDILILTPLAGFLGIALGLAIGIILAKIAKLRKHSQDNAFAYCMGVYNWGYIPIPLTYSLFGAETVGVLFIFNLGVQLAMWSIALIVLTYRPNNATKREPLSQSLIKLLLNPPILAIFVGLLLNTFQAETWIPTAAQDLISTLGASSIPLGLLLVGASFLDVFREASLLRPLHVGILSIVGKLIIIPFLILGLLYILPLPIDLQRVLIIQAAMPAAVMAILYTKHYQADIHTTAQCVVFTSCASIITIPLFIQFALSFFGVGT